MTISTTTALIGIDDIKLYPVTNDSDNTFICSNAVQIDGIKNFTLSLTFDEKELKDSEKIIAISSKIIAVNFKIDYARINLNSLGSIFGGSVISCTSNNKESASYSFCSNNFENYFQLQAKIKGTEKIKNGNCHICIYKAKIIAMPINSSDKDFSTFSIEGKGIFTKCLFDGSQKILDFDFYSSDTALAPKICNN